MSHTHFLSRSDEYFEVLASVSEPITFRRDDPFSVRSSPTSTMREEVGMGLEDAVGRAPSAPAFVTLLAAARGGNAQARGELLQSFRPYLLSIARRGLPGYLRGKFDGSDLVQETLLKAHRGFASFDRSDTDGFRIWLRGILRHNVTDLIRRYGKASKRSADQERSLGVGLESGEL
jgi:Sigma-70 region 2